MLPHVPPPASPIDEVAGQSARTYRVAGELRRSLIYVAVGGIVALVLMAMVPRPNPQPIEPARLVGLGLILIGLPLLVWLYLSTWRLRIDETGLCRRRLGCWTCWTWESIASGKVRFGKYGILWNKSAPWWDSAIGVGLIGRDGRFVIDALKRVLPEDSESQSDCSEPIPAEVAVRTWFPFQWIRVRSAGIELLRSGRTAVYHWDEVERLRVIRYPHGDCYVHLIELDLSGGRAIRGNLAGVRVDQQAVLRVNARRAVWVRQLAKIVPPDKWQCFDMSGDLHSAEEARHRVEFWQKRRRPLLLFPWLGIAMLPLAGMKFIPAMWAMWNVPFPIVWKVLALVAMFLSMVMPTFLLCLVSWFVRAEMLKRVRNAEEQLQELLEAQASGQATCERTDFRRMFHVQVQS